MRLWSCRCERIAMDSLLWYRIGMIVTGMKACHLKTMYQRSCTNSKAKSTIPSNRLIPAKQGSGCQRHRLSIIHHSDDPCLHLGSNATPRRESIDVEYPLTTIPGFSPPAFLIFGRVRTTQGVYTTLLLICLAIVGS